MSDSGEVHRSTKFGKAPEEMLCDKTLTDGAVRLYAYMHLRFMRYKSNDDDQKTIAEALGVSRTTIKNRMEDLAARDWIIIIERRPTAKRQYQTNYYHIFEVPKDCRQFRQTYKALPGIEYVNPRPDIKARKSRKGIGGNPAVRANSSWHGRVNSGWHGVYDPTVLTQVGMTLLTQVGTSTIELLSTERDKDSSALKRAERETPDTVALNILEKQERKALLDGVWDAIGEVWPDLKDACGYRGKMRKFMLGECVKADKEWHTHQLSRPVTPEEVLSFGKWYTQKYPDLSMPTKPETLEKMWSEFRVNGKQPKSSAAPLKTDVPKKSVWAEYDVRMGYRKPAVGE